MSHRKPILILSVGILIELASGCSQASSITPSIAPPTKTPSANDILASYNADPCNPPEGMAVDGAASANVQIWHDLNENGMVDSGEPPLPWITFMVGDYTEGGPHATDKFGLGSGYEFMPGCSCECWRGKSVSIQIPYGYTATTPSTQVLTNDYKAIHQFGLKLRDPDLAFDGEPDWHLAFLGAGFKLTSFHYEPTNSHLDMTIDNSDVSDMPQFYTNLADIFYLLRYSDEPIMFDEFRLVLSEPTTTMLCPFDSISENWVWSDGFELFKRYCTFEH